MCEWVNVRAKRESDSVIESAWLVAQLMRAAEIPKLEKLLKPENSNEIQKEQTDTDMENVARMWNAALGGKVEAGG